MRFRRVTLLVVIYLALDFANPMMPGAVHLVEGSIEMVAGCQARTAEDPAPILTIVPRRLWTVTPQREPTRSAWQVLSVSPPTLFRLCFRAPLEPRSTPASSSDDD
jgi:hypothetical protein